MKNRTRRAESGSVGYARKNKRWSYGRHESIPVQATWAIDAEATAGDHITRHARIRMDSRGIGWEAVCLALDFGRVAYVRGAQIYAIGRKEVAALAERGITADEYSGVQVVCANDNTVITVYRNKDFSGLRHYRRRRY